MTVTELLKHLNNYQPFNGITFESIAWDFSNQDLDIGSRKLKFEACTFETLLFAGLESEDAVIEFKSCVFKSNQTIFLNLKCFSLSFENCTFEEVNVQASTFIDLSFSENKAKLTHINTCKSEDIVIGNEHGIIEKLILYATEAQEIEIFSQHTIDALVLRKIKKATIIGDFKNVTFDSNECELIRFGTFRSTAETIFSSHIGSFEAVSLNFPGHLSIQNARIEKFTLIDVSSSGGSISLNGVSINKCDISECSITKMYWNQVHFNGELSIDNSDLSGLRMAHVKWPRGKRVSDSFLEDPIGLSYRWRKEDDKYDASDLIDLQNERDLYRQLKAACHANHNHIEALDFYRNEMRLYWKEILINGGVPNTDCLLIFLNRWVSDFGQSWLLPLCWLLVMNLLFYLWLIHFNLDFSGKSFSHGCEQYVELLNPVHKKPYYIDSGGEAFIDLLSRVLNSFFIYHFIRATRKFAKV